MRRALTLDQYEAGVLAGDRAVLARAITLVESTRPDQQALALALVDRILPRAGGAARVGISGVPGAGKSTLIDALGLRLISDGHRLAVLAVDPSSTVSGGSILADKSRMPRLARDPRAFIRPSPSARTLGGVGRRTREALLLCEAAGYDVVLVETVGVGQSETLVADMVDSFVLLLVPGAGDEIQGIKRGIVELADVVAVNKADGDRKELARRAARDYRAALRYLRPRGSWRPPVLTVSAAEGRGLEPLWGAVERHRAALAQGGGLEARRRDQRRRWLWHLVDEALAEAFRRAPAVAVRLGALERAVAEGRTSPGRAALELLEAFGVAGGAG